MTDTIDHGHTTAPSRCGNCQSPLETPVVCFSCNAVFEDDAEPDYFAQFGLPLAFDIDLDFLEKQYMKLSRALHPDYFAGQSGELQDLSLRLSSSVNDGYRALKDPARRAGYLLRLLGGKSASEDKRTPDGFLMEAMEWQEEVEEALGAGDNDAKAALRKKFEEKKRDAIDRAAADFRRIESGEDKETAMDAIRLTLNEVGYYERFIRHLNEK